MVVVVGGGGGQMCNYMYISMEWYPLRNKLIYQRIATALRVQSYLGAVCPEDQKLSAEMQIG